MVVVHKGQIVGERYMAGITKDTQLESWSMGKSLTATLVGLVVKDGAFTLDDPAPVPDWRRPGDPARPDPRPRRDADVERAQLHRPGRPLDGSDAGSTTITSSSTPARSTPSSYSITSPVEFAPNTVGRYRNSDPMTLGFLVRQAVEKKRRGST